MSNFYDVQELYQLAKACTGDSGLALLRRVLK